MKLEDVLGAFYAGQADGATIAHYLDQLAHDDARARRGVVQREIDALRATIANLEREKADLEASIERLGFAKLELLLVFLPVFFRQFWTEVRPEEVAMMCGLVEVPSIPSPYPEPSRDTVRHMKRRFMELDLADRERILVLCRDLAPRLQVRTEMRPLL